MSPGSLKPLKHLSPRRQRRRLRSMEAMRSVARGVFERKGYIDTVIEDIIGAADVGRGTFYNYFSSKDEVFSELIRSLVDELIAAGTEVGDERSIRERLHLSIGRMLGVARKNRKLLVAVDQAIHVNEAHAKRWGVYRRRLEERIARDLDWCRRHGFIERSVDTKLLAMVVTGTIESTVLEATARGLDAAKAEAILVDVYWNMVFRPHEGADDYVIERGGAPKSVFAR